MIHFVCGKLGSGKGLVSMQVLLDELRNGDRDVVTNLPIKLAPWVNGSGQAQVGLVGYLRREYGEDFDCERRILVVDDVKEGGDMWLYRRDPDRGWFKVQCDYDSKGQPVSFNAEQMKGCKPLLCITDEAWQFYPARSWQNIPRVLEFYARQQRKLRDEWYIVSQHHKDVDCLLHRVIQDFTVCRNHGMERLGIFRQPAVFRTQTYNQPPQPSSRVMHERMFRLDVKGLAQCYDTSAGVGIAGGFAADRNREKKGLHPAFLIALVVLLVVIVGAVPFGLGKAARSFITRAVTGRDLRPAERRGPMMVLPDPGPPPTKEPAPSLRESVVPSPGPTVEVSDVRVTGWAPSRGGLVVFLSDGRRLHTSDSRLRRITEDGCWYDGQFIPMASLKSSEIAVYDPVTPRRW